MRDEPIHKTCKHGDLPKGRLSCRYCDGDDMLARAILTVELRKRLAARKATP